MDEKQVSKELEIIYSQIEMIDHQLVNHFDKKAKLIKALSKYKIKNNISYDDFTRKENFMSQIEKEHADNNELIEILNMYTSTEKICETIEKNHLALKQTPDYIIGYQGTEGAYSEESTIAYFGESCAKKNYDSFESVLNALATEEIDYGVLPIENSSTGVIKEVYDLLIKYGCYITGEHNLRVNHHLIGLEDTKIENLEEIYSHPQGLEQCSKYLSYYPHWKKISYLNTASSVKKIAANKNTKLAAIGSKRAAEIYNLTLLKENINNNQLNTTRFIVLSRHMEINKDCNKISLVFTTPHSAGALSEIIAVFAKFKLNMMKIESRPIKYQPGQYYFFVDIEGHLKSKNVSEALQAINDHQRYFRVLGNYEKKEGFC